MGEDPIGTVFALLLLVFGITLLPMLIVQNNVDAQARSQVESIVQDFTDNARSTGYFTREEYNVFKAELSKCGYPFHVEMLHRSKMVLPNEREEGTYTTAYNAYNFDDIMEVLEETGKYSMKNGDFFQIKLTSIGSTKGSLELAAILGGGGQKMIIPAGGMVGNTN